MNKTIENPNIKTSDSAGTSRTSGEINISKDSFEEILSANRSLASCPAHIAFIIDESGSINNQEALQIRTGLQSFINNQLDSSFYISFIGMSASDNDSRVDHLIYQRITKSSKINFDNWIEGYRNRNISSEADYWASGLQVIQSMNMTFPDIVIIITDGLQVKNSQTLLDRILNLNNQSHIFVYGIQTGFYDNGFGGNATLIKDCLEFYLGRSPILSTNNSDVLVTDYAEILDFTELGTALSGLSQVLIQSQVGCGNIEIIQNNTSVENLVPNTSIINLSSGTIRVRNNKSSNHTIAINTQIAAINGIVFKTSVEVVVSPNGAEANVPISIIGTPFNTGAYIKEISISGVLNPQSFKVQFSVESQIIIPITELTSLQSPNFYLQSVGSRGIESAKGIHLRWIFGGALGEKHLPKRNYAETTHNFNKPNDVVNVYRTIYEKVQFKLNLLERPTIINDTNKFWIYRFANDGDSYYQFSEVREFHVYFRNTSKYNQVRASVNPLLNPSEFLQNYGSELIEIENKKEIFFAAEFKANNLSASSVLQTESLSVSENNQFALKKVSSRQTFSSSQLSEMRLVCENGKSIRFKPTNCEVSEITFEFYADFIAAVNKRDGWQTIGDFGLTLDDGLVNSMLEPEPGLVQGKWQRFNDNAFVNVENYKTKWDRQTEDWDRDIKQIVNNYIQLSNSATNPTAIESVPFENIEDEPIEISNLDQLNFAAYDYHIARMLGLGVLDVDVDVFENTYIYIAEYTTFGDLEDGLGKRETHHLSMGLPTSIDDERLPIPVNIRAVTPGAFIGNEGEPANITDAGGYTQNGESRYVTLFAENQPTDLIGTLFYETAEEFALEKFTYPVYSGIEYKRLSSGQTCDDGEWQKPELPNDPEYLNAVPLGEVEHPETRVLQISETNQPLYVHKQDVSGLHCYSSYGINWFSRATSSSINKSIQTLLKPKNSLLPPSNINSLLIRSESPLLLTSEEEQDRLKSINPNPESETVEDETLVRITFDYHTYQDLINRKVPFDSVVTNNDILDANNIDNRAILYPDNEEVFADEVDIFFRSQVPDNISGRALPLSATNQPSNILLSNIQTVDYQRASTGEINPITNVFEPEIISPILQPGSESNYVGGAFILGNQQHIIHSVIQGTDGPIFSVYKKEISDALVSDIPSADADNLQPIEITEDGFFMAVENMQNASSWGTPNPLPLKVNIAVNNEIHREILEILDDDGIVERHVEKSRGIWSEPLDGNATIEKVEEPYEAIYDSEGNITGYNERHRGNYKITFQNVKLTQHPQYNKEGLSVEWFRGIARIFTQGSLQDGVFRKTRKVLSVIKIDNIVYPGDANQNDLVIYVNDSSFPEANEDEDLVNDIEYDYIQTGANISVNFYPSYKVYLYEDTTYRLDETNILPEAGDGTKYSIFGLRSRDLDLEQYASKISVPSLMFAQEMNEALPPEQPQGPLYATRPDFFGRSTLTLTTQYKHEPHGLLFYRTNDEALLNALYAKSTIIEIRESLKALGGSDEVDFTSRWQNFLKFEALKIDGDYKEFPSGEIDAENRFKFPNPDKLAFFTNANEIINNINNGIISPPNPPIALFNIDLDDADNDIGAIPVGDERIFGFVKGAIYNAFVPLTEVPIIYQHIKGADYKPVNEKQVVRDRNGYVLLPTHEEFKMAPMMKIINTNPHETQFVDFSLDGTSKNIYFYGVREISSQMKMGDYSPFLGPVKLVNTNAPETPEIKRIMPVLENVVLGISPSIQLEINAYPEVQDIKKLTIYRAFNKLDAQSVRTMKQVKIIDLETLGIINDAIWNVQDTFDDLDEVPYGDGLFYRITVSRKVEYADKNGSIVIDYQSSQASKIVASMMVEVTNPPAPILNFTSDALINSGRELPNIILQWDKTCYKGKYHVYKMNNNGTWVSVHNLKTNDSTIYLPLLDTDLNSGTLQIRNEDYDPIYHHFKVVAENTSGMRSIEENILTIPNTSILANGEGIGFMIIEDTNIVD